MTPTQDTTHPGASHPWSALALAAAGPIAIGGVMAARANDPTPLATAPCIVFGVVAATAPALYIAIATTRQAATLTKVARSFGAALGAFGIVLAGLVLPALFLSLSSVSPLTTVVVCSCALAGAGVLALIRLATELAPRTFSGGLVYVLWAIATLGIAARLWVDLGMEVLS